jgi:paraquat-inducible protein B
MIWLFTLPVVEEGIYIGSISSEDIENFDDDKKVVDYKYTLASFFHEQIQSGSKYWKFC